ncbi:MAG: bifunctional 5,10-methylenetetrahydrofolate dehydrogenase/5,10-methenyltetrahydrofolate cyclohydrolase [Candidatus Buchananbacteria bacterium]
MTAKIIDGKKIADNLLLELRQKIKKLERAPGLAVVLIGEDEASKLYVRNKKRACHKVGINFYDYYCGGACFSDITEEKILETIDFLNNDPEIDGMIVQLPIPKKFDTEKIINRIKPEKDVDGFCEVNKNKFLAGDEGVISPLIQAISEAIKSTGQNLEGKMAVVVSNNEAYSQTRKKDLEQLGLEVKIIKPEKGFENETKKADVLVVIAGQSNLIKKSMVKDGAIVIDVGTNFIGENKWTGDVDLAVAEIASYITPVPGGVGPLTVVMLLNNVYEMAKNHQ